MWLTHLSLENYRGFQKLELDFHRRLTVLVGTNGSGKSSVLDAVAMMAGDIAKHTGLVIGELSYLSLKDMSIGAEFESGGLTVQGAQGETRWATSIDRAGRWRQTDQQASPAAWLRSPEFIVVYETTDRTVQSWGFPDLDTRRVKTTLEIGLEGGLEPYNFSLRRFNDWFRQAEDLENEQRVRRKALEYRLPVLEGLRQSVRALLGADQIEFRRSSNLLMVVRGDKAFALSQLSEGERGLLLLVGDIARRLAQRLQDVENPLQAQATILIDEIELHLHPGWQRKVIGELQRVFPNCQFVVATHSPQVLSTIPRDSQIVLLENFQPHLLPAAEGRDSNSILNAVFGVPERPEAMVKELQEVARLIDDDKYEEAKARIAGMEKVLTSEDPGVVHYRSLIDFMERGRAADQEGP